MRRTQLRNLYCSIMFLLGKCSIRHGLTVGFGAIVRHRAGGKERCLNMVKECGTIYIARHHSPVLKKDAWAWWSSEVQFIARCQWWHSVVLCTVRHQCVMPDSDTRASCRSVAPDCGPCVCKSRIKFIILNFLVNQKVPLPLRDV